LAPTERGPTEPLDSGVPVETRSAASEPEPGFANFNVG